MKNPYHQCKSTFLQDLIRHVLTDIHYRCIKFDVDVVATYKKL